MEKSVVDGMQEPKDEESCCEMLASRHDLIVAFLNSWQLWLPHKTYVKQSPPTRQDDGGSGSEGLYPN